jgi:hypothetical protein
LRTYKFISQKDAMSLTTMHHSGCNKYGSVRALDSRSTYFIKRNKQCSADYKKASFSSHIQFFGKVGERVLRKQSKATFLPECAFKACADTPLRFLSTEPTHVFRWAPGKNTIKMGKPCLL